jgi:membrane protease YdiL (CAAX protease family)
MLECYNDTKSVKEIRDSARGATLWKESLIAAGICFASTLFVALPQFIVLALMFGLEALNNSAMNDFNMMVVSLYTTVFTTIFFVLFCKFIQRRSLRTIGFKTKGIFKQYALGLVVGLVMFTAAICIGWLAGAFEFVGVEKQVDLAKILLIFGGFILQGMSEEVMCRGYVMTTIIRKNTVYAGVVVNSLIFAALHCFNAGFGMLPLINLTLFGVFASVYMLKTGDIWGVSAVHTIWNFVQSSFYGLSVSGMDLMPSIFRFKQTDVVILNGGAFGPEGGLITTVVLVVSISIVLSLSKKKQKVR